MISCSLKYIIKAGFTQAIRRFNKGLVYSPLPIIDRSDRSEHLADISLNLRYNPGVSI